MRAAVSFLTVAGRSSAPGAPGPRTSEWFAPVGALLGALLGGLWWLSAKVWPPAVAAAVVVVADLALTGMLHFDGLVDCGDGLVAPMTRERRLEVMSAPEAGAFGVGVGGAVLLLRWAALFALRPSVLLLAGLWALSRAGMAAVIRTRPYARSGGGLASAFAGDARRVVLTAGILAGVALCAAWRPAPGLVAVSVGLCSGALVVALAQRRLGGYTGDVLGATALIGETFGLIAAAARW